MRLRFKLMLGAAFFLSTALVFRGCRKHDGIDKPSPAPSLALPPNDQAKVSIDGHKWVVETPQKTVTQYIPDHAIVEVKKNGELVTHIQEFGIEHSPYFGLSMGDQLRVQMGCRFLYFNRLDVGIGFGFATNRNTDLVNIVRLNANLSYNFWSNTSVFVGVDHTGMLLGGIQVKL